MDTDFQDLLERFAAFGGIADNICLRNGALGRGIFPIDPSRRAKIMTPKSLLINREYIGIRHDEIYINEVSQFSAKEKEFVEFNYNYAWSRNGNIHSAEFLNYISTLPESVRSQLLCCGFVDQDLLDASPDEDSVLKRFIDERVVTFKGNSVLASVWDLVNHCSFAPPLRIAPYGVETPPIEPGPGELLFKYSGRNSPMSMWRKYGFACRCIVAYSIPFKINISNQSLNVSCYGRFGLDSKEKKGFSIEGDTLSIKSLPVGCLSIGLPFENFKSILSSAGLSTDVAKRLFPKVRELNLKSRSDLVDNLQEAGLGAKAELYKALMYEIELIGSSSFG